MKKFMLCILLTGITALLAAHEFWLDPGKFFYRKGDTMHLQFLVGEDFNGENWGGSNAKVNTLVLHGDSTAASSIASLVTQKKGDTLSIPLTQEGTQMVTFNSTNSFISLAAKEFNGYLSEDQLTDAIAYRQQHHETDSIGREFYQRSVKTIFQVGTRFTNTYSKKTELPLDLIPLQNPYQLEDDDSLAIRVLFKGQPLKNQFVVVWHRNKSIFLKVQYRTDVNGEVRFPVMARSKWMVSTVKMVRLPKDAGADWQSYWGSLTWGYQ